MTGYLIAYWFGFLFMVGIASEAGGSTFDKAFCTVCWPLYLPMTLGAMLVRNSK